MNVNETKYAISIVNGCKLTQNEINRNKLGDIKYYENGSMKSVNVKYNWLYLIDF